MGRRYARVSACPDRMLKVGFVVSTLVVNTILFLPRIASLKPA